MVVKGSILCGYNIPNYRIFQKIFTENKDRRIGKRHLNLSNIAQHHSHKCTCLRKRGNEIISAFNYKQPICTWHDNFCYVCSKSVLVFRNLEEECGVIWIELHYFSEMLKWNRGLLVNANVKNLGKVIVASQMSIIPTSIWTLFEYSDLDSVAYKY